MFLDRIIMENVGPIDNLDIGFPFNEDGSPKPIIFVGENGKGKSTVLSNIVDSLFEFAKQPYNDITETNKDGTTPYFKVLSWKNTKVGCDYSFSFINFVNGEQNFQYIEKLGNLSFEQCIEKTSGLLNLDNNWGNRKNIKDITKNKEYFEEEFANKSFCFFPPNRYETPHWMNQNIVSENLITINDKISGKLNKPIIVQNVTETNIKWLLDIIVDSRADLIQSDLGGWNSEQDLNNIRLLKIARENVEEILSEIVKKDVKFGLNWRNSGGSRFNIIDRSTNSMIIPTLDALSTGESALFNMFSTIIRYSDYGDINKSIKLNEIEGIVIIDEIDLHLHSSIQCDVLPKLIKKFPKVQFIITSHSPLFILGMKDIFKEDGFKIYEMPTGENIGPEEFSEFERSYEYYKRTELFSKYIQDILKSKNGKTLIITEGKTDWKHMKAGLLKLKEQGLYHDLDIEFLEYENDIKMGYNNLINICEAASKLRNNNKVICVFDRDLSDRDLRKVKDENTNYKLWGNNVISMVLPLPDNRVEIDKIMCIEHYYSDEEIKTFYKGRRLFLGDEFNSKLGLHILGDKICQDKNKCGKKSIIDSGCVVCDIKNPEDNIALSKNDFADSILNGVEEFKNISFENFKLVFDLIQILVNE
ncbi:ATP-binding protein [Clostridioides difficile]|nr:ATP-binding protein [Clostridioides difficile]